MSQTLEDQLYTDWRERYGRDCVTLREAQEAIGVGKTTMYELRSNGEIESFRIRRGCRVPLRSLARFAAMGAEAVPPKPK